MWKVSESGDDSIYAAGVRTRHVQQARRLRSSPYIGCMFINVADRSQEYQSKLANLQSITERRIN